MHNIRYPAFTPPSVCWSPPPKKEHFLLFLEGHELAINSEFFITFFFYSYMWMGDSWKYPRVKSIRYPKEGSTNPNVTVFVVDLSVLKFINKIQIKHPDSINSSYVGNMIWVSSTDLSVTFTNREQTSALTVLCRAPNFNCVEVWFSNIFL